MVGSSAPVLSEEDAAPVAPPRNDVKTAAGEIDLSTWVTQRPATEDEGQRSARLQADSDDQRQLPRRLVAGWHPHDRLLPGSLLEEGGRGRAPGSVRARGVRTARGEGRHPMYHCAETRESTEEPAGAARRRAARREDRLVGVGAHTMAMNRDLMAQIGQMAQRLQNRAGRTRGEARRWHGRRRRCDRRPHRRHEGRVAQDR